jgi:hypothetical protein
VKNENKMAHGIIRAREIAAGEVGATDIHNDRKYDELGIKSPNNIKREQSSENRTFFIVPNEREYVEEANLKEVIDSRIAQVGAKVRANSVVAIEFVCSASKEFYDVYSASGHFSNCEKWLEERYGKGNVVARYEHYDESTPHAHFIVVPIVEKEIHWKNQKGEGKRKESRLCARDLTGNKEKLSQLQEDYYKFMKPFSRHGVEFYRGTKATNDLKRYSKYTDHELGELRSRFHDLEKRYTHMQDLLEKGKISPEMAQKELNEAKRKVEEINNEKKALQTKMEDLKEEAAKKEARREKYNAGDKWKKGFDFF